MKLKTVTIENKTYAEVDASGLPVYLHDDGKEIGFDALQAKQKITQLNGEAATNRQRYEAAETSLKLFEGLDAEKAKAALQTVQNLDDKKLVDAGEIEKMKTQLAETYKQTYDPQINQLTQERDQALQGLNNELIGGGFSRSKFIQDKIAVPTDMIQAAFGKHFKVEDGKVVAYGADGQKILSRTNMGGTATFDEALEVLVGGYQYKDSILKGNQSTGGGFSGQGGNPSGPKSLSECKTEAEKVAYLKQVGEQK
nr:DUF6651 domain-containing protein [uncultured Acinetobacter sp.]